MEEKPNTATSISKIDFDKAIRQVYEAPLRANIILTDQLTFERVFNYRKPWPVFILFPRIFRLENKWKRLYREGKWRFDHAVRALKGEDCY